MDLNKKVLSCLIPCRKNILSLISMIYSPTFILIVHFQTRDPISIESRQVFFLTILCFQNKVVYPRSVKQAKAES